MLNNRVRSIVVRAVLALVASPLIAGFAGTDVFLPSVGAKLGVVPAVWYTTVWVHNPNPTAAYVTFYLLERQANPAPLTLDDTIPPGETRKYDNAVQLMFGKQTFGALRVTSAVRVLACSRVYSQAGELKDSVGQFFAGVPASFAIGSGQSTELLGAYGTLPAADSTFRYNFGFVETTGTGTCQVKVTVKDAIGTELGAKSYSLQQWEQAQKTFSTEFPDLSTQHARLTVEVTSGNGRIIAFASGVANGSQDPATFEMSFRDDLLGVNGGLASVSHDSTLAGDGTTASPLGIATGAVGKTKLAASGGTDGQVLGTNGTNLVWQNAGLTLPYSGSVWTYNTAAFAITNTATAPADTETIALSGTSDGIGVYGESHRIGVEGFSSGTITSGGIGVYGESNGIGVMGETMNGRGVFGIGRAGGYGVYGEVFSGGYAGYFKGDARVTRNLFKAAGSFEIDHPLDPAGKYLYHSFVESPDMMSIYNGNVTTDGSGEAVIVLPVWFEALNRDFRYQLTVIGAGDVWAQARVSREIEGDRFTVQTSVPNTKVSWQVTGIRHDAYAEAHRIPVEVAKPAPEQGFYLHPELFGAPEEKGVEWARHPELMQRMKAKQKKAEEALPHIAR